MTWYKEHFDLEGIVWKVIVGNVCHIYFSFVLHNGIDFDTVLQIVCNSNYLWMITLHINLLDLTLAEPINISPNKVFKQK